MEITMKSVILTKWKHHFIVCIIMLFTCLLFGDEMAYIYTPNGSLVPNTYWREEGWTDDEKAAIQQSYLNSNPGIEIITTYGDPSPTWTYNCHGYAWHMMGGHPNEKVWIGYWPARPAEEIYWNDGSYIECDETDAEKVSYTGNHSAITTSASGYYISKWGPWVLCRHRWDNCPPEFGKPLKFYKRAATSQSIQVVSPNGGENWKVGSSHNITWNSTGTIANVKIDYSINSGRNWINIVTSTANDGNHPWTIPNTPSTTCKMRVSDALNAAINDISNANFTISAAVNPTVTVTSPNGGESWRDGSTHNITWTSTGQIANVKIEYSIDSGVSYRLITASTGNNGSYSWRVSDPLSKHCLVKISHYANPNIFDTSDAVFEIYAQLPTFNITATAGAGGTISPASAMVTQGNNQIFNIRPSSGYGIQLVMVDNTYDVTAYVKSNGNKYPFYDVQANHTIAATFAQIQIGVTILTPNGGENWEYNTYQNITWSAPGITGNIQLGLYRNGKVIGWIANCPASSGTYSWKVGTYEDPERIVPAGSGYSIKINSWDGVYTDTSNAPFSIYRSSGSLTLTAPNGGDNWQLNTYNNITWSAPGVTGNVALTLYRNGARVGWIANCPASQGSYSWKTGTYEDPQIQVPVGGGYAIEIKSMDGSYIDESNATFAISAADTPTVTVTSPNGGENWTVGLSYNITWSSTGTIANVKIEYSTNNGSSWSDIVASIANNGSHAWTIPNTPSTTCQVRVSDAANTATNDVSNATFTISAAVTPTVTVTSPNGGENWEYNTYQNITWNAPGITGNIQLGLYRNGINIGWIANCPAASGTYSWKVGTYEDPERIVPAGSGYSIKINSWNGVYTDTSNAPFNIYRSSGSLTLTAPNGGENWQLNTYNNITWSAPGVAGNVALTLYCNGSRVGWIATCSASQGSYSWKTGTYEDPQIQVPVGGGYAIEIASTDGSFIDESNAAFNIVNPSVYITLTAPNGGESWRYNTYQNITWNAQGISGNVMIVLYRYGAPVAWLANWAAYKGTFDWRVGFDDEDLDLDLPAGGGYSIFIKSWDGVYTDTSDGTFTIY
jgi:hypothetical protein